MPWRFPFLPTDEKSVGYPEKVYVMPAVSFYYAYKIYIFSLDLYIFSLNLYMFSLRLYKFSLKIELFR